MNNENKKSYVDNIVNDILKGLLDLQLIYFKDEELFFLITDVLSKYSDFLYIKGKRYENKKS